MGLPASSDVGFMSKMIAQLRTEAEAGLSQHVDSAVITYLTLPGLFEEAIRDAADYVSIRTVTGYFHQQPRQLFATYAGYGMGLCSRGGSYYDCRDELLALPVRDVLHAECASGALLLHVQRVQAAFDTAISDVTASSHFNDRNNLASPYEPSMLVQSIASVLEKYYRFIDRPKSMIVMLSGDKGDDPSVVKIISETVSSFGSKPELLNKEVEFIGARGAAELAWRAADRQIDSADDPL